MPKIRENLLLETTENRAKCLPIFWCLRCYWCLFLVSLSFQATVIDVTTYPCRFLSLRFFNVDNKSLNQIIMLQKNVFNYIYYKERYLDHENRTRDKNIICWSKERNLKYTLCNRDVHECRGLSEYCNAMKQLNSPKMESRPAAGHILKCKRP